MSPPDDQLIQQIERVVRRVKRALGYHGSHTTNDFLSGLIEKWIKSGEYERLRALPPAERRIGPSVRHFIIDRLRGRDRENKVPFDDLQLPDDDALAALVEDEIMRLWMSDEIAKLERGELDATIRSRPTFPKESGAVLRLTRDGMTQRQIVDKLGMSLATVNARLADGVRYLNNVALKAGL